MHAVAERAAALEGEAPTTGLAGAEESAGDDDEEEVVFQRVASSSIDAGAPADRVSRHVPNPSADLDSKEKYSESYDGYSDAAASLTELTDVDLATPSSMADGDI